MIATSNLSFIEVVALGEIARVSWYLLIPNSFAAIVLDENVVLPILIFLAAD